MDLCIVHKHLYKTKYSLKQNLYQFSEVTNYKDDCGDVPDSPVVRFLTSTAGGMSSIPGQETNIPQAVAHTANKQTKRKDEVLCRNSIY